MMRTWTALAGLGSLLILLTAGCQTTPTSGTDVPPGVCGVWEVVKLSHADTAETISQVKRNNAARRALCGGEDRP